MRAGPKIPIVGYHRGVGLHADQDEARLELVRGHIDQVVALGDPDLIVRFMEDPSRAPEARMFAEAKLTALYQFCAEKRTVRPDIDMDYVTCLGAGLDSQRWQSPVVYGTIFDQGDPRAMPRPAALVQP